MGLMQMAHAASSPEGSAAPPPAQAALVNDTGSTSSVYVVKKGDTLLGLARSQYKGSPLRPEILRDAILAANPELGKLKGPAPRPGTRLVLPDHAQIMLNVVSNVVTPQDLSRLIPAPEVVDAGSRRDWVRFP
jgi:phage tail protein X